MTLIPPERADAVDDGVRERGFLLLVLDPAGIALAVDEMEGIDGLDLVIDDVELAVVEDLEEPLGRRQAEMEAAGRADRQVIEDVLLVEDPLAVVAAGPEIFGHGEQ